MLDQKVFGEKLRNHRKKLGMTQEEVAEKVGVSPQVLCSEEGQKLILHPFGCRYFS